MQLQLPLRLLINDAVYFGKRDLFAVPQRSIRFSQSRDTMNVSGGNAKALADSFGIAEFAFVAGTLPVLFTQRGFGHVETDHERAFRTFAADATLFTEHDAARRFARREMRDLDVFARLEIENDHW